MQKFTRALTREIEVGGERLALTLSTEGVSVRLVGLRKPPLDLDWPSILCACAGKTKPRVPFERVRTLAVSGVQLDDGQPAE